MSKNIPDCINGLKNEIAEFGLKSHSGQVGPGDVFVALPGDKAPEFIAQAVAGGAAAIVADAGHIENFKAANPGKGDGVRFCPLSSPDFDPRDALALLATEKFKTGNLPFPVVAITGTNGKTTITYLFEHLYRARGKRAGIMGTVSYRWPGHKENAPLTTPDCLTVHASLAKMRDQAKVDTAFLEVSSHALSQKRVLGVDFYGAIFTNLTQDHLDYHRDMDDYFSAKAKLFFTPYAGAGQVAVINQSQPYGKKLLAMLPNEERVISYGLEDAPEKTGANSSQPHLQGRILSSSTSGLHLAMNWQANGENRAWEIKTPLIGAYNAENLLAVQAMALRLGFVPQDFDCFASFTGTPGRMERIENPRGLHVFVDYAHSPDALVNVQKELKNVGFKRLITVFGCGGNRDRAKRPLMGEAVARYADIAVLTSDNPRCEDPLAIMEDVLPGLKNCSAVIQEPDRRQAIARALELAGPDDALLVAGKGHEDYQIIGTTKYPFSDQEIIREMLLCK